MKTIEGFPKRQFNEKIQWAPLKKESFSKINKEGCIWRQFTKLQNIFFSNFPDAFDFQPNFMIFWLDAKHTFLFPNYACAYLTRYRNVSKIIQEDLPLWYFVFTFLKKKKRMIKFQEFLQGSNAKVGTDWLPCAQKL